MFIPITQSNLKSKLVSRLVMVLVVCWMAIYPIYTNYYKGLAIEQYERFLDFKAGKSMFYNPWQYRILCPLLIEGTYQVLDNSFFMLFSFQKTTVELPGSTGDKNETVQKLVRLSQEPKFIKYTIVFVGFRLIQHLLIFWLAFQYLSLFVRNQALILLGIMMIPIFMGNAVMDSDLAFNSYMDIILYLWAGLIIIKGYSGWWIVLITFIGALNRETSLLIPAIYFTAQLNWDNWKSPIHLLMQKKNAVLVVAVSSVLFLVVFVSIRTFYGYQPQTEWRVPAGWAMLKLNLFSSVSAKTYSEMFGVFGFLPVWCILVFKKIPKILQIFFLTLVPIWFGVHLISVVAYQSRLFLVPTLLIFLPAVLNYIETEILKQD